MSEYKVTLLGEIDDLRDECKHLQAELETEKEYVAKYYASKGYYEELARTVRIEADGYFKCIEDRDGRLGKLKAENENLKERIDGYKRHAKYLKQVISRNL